MAKKGELWDDSALVKALDDAISKYKIMHCKGGDTSPLKEERIAKDTEESVPNVFDDSNEVKSLYVQTDDNITDVLKNTIDSSVSEKTTSEVVEQHVNPSNGDQVQDTDCTYTNAEKAGHYNLLLDQYNAIEEQRQKLLQQLYQYGNWDYQAYGYGAGYDPQYQTVPAPQTSELPACSCRPYVCPNSTAPCTCTSLAAHNGASVSLEDDGFIKAAKGAVDKAICSFKKEASGVPNVDQEGQEKTSQMDLSVVLNAWFSAGLYTGKYLSEQASAKK